VRFDGPVTDGCEGWPICLCLSNSVTVGKPTRTHDPDPALVNCRAAISCPALADPRITRTLTDVHVDRGAVVDGAGDASLLLGSVVVGVALGVAVAVADGGAVAVTETGVGVGAVVVTAGADGLVVPLPAVADVHPAAAASISAAARTAVA
jgi:hypothetical protein